MRLLAIVVGIILIILSVIGLQGTTASAATGAITLSSQPHSAVKGWVTLSADDKNNTFVNVQATGMEPLSSHGFALMDAHCIRVVQLLNPLMASIAGDGNSVSVASGKPNGTWWFGILAGTSATSTAVACGTVGGSVPVAPTTKPKPTATPSSSLVPVHQGTAPPDAPVVNPNATPTPLGS